MEPPQAVENGVTGNEVKSSPKFNAKVVRSLSITLVALGMLSIGVGIAVLVVSIPLICTFRIEQDYYTRHQPSPPPPTYEKHHCRYLATYSSPGLWGGLMFVASGIIGIFSAKRRTICFIVTMMTVSIVTTWISVCSMALSVIAHFDRRYPQQNYYPASLHVLDSVVTLISLVCFILSWINFGHACRAVCCNGAKKYPAMKQMHQRYQYQPLQSQPSYDNPQIMNVGGHQATSVPQPSNTASLTEPIYLVQGHKVIGVLPQNFQPPGTMHTNKADNPVGTSTEFIGPP